MDDALATLAAAQKYLMDDVLDGVLQELKTLAEEGDTLRIYAIACKSRSPEVMRIAAKASLCKPLQFDPIADELNDITGAMLARLLKYRQLCADAVSVVASGQEFVWITRSYNFLRCWGSDTRIYIAGRTSSELVPKWWTQYMNTAHSMLANAPHSRTIFHASLTSQLRYHAYHESPYHTYTSEVHDGFKDDIDQFESEFVAAVDKAISKVELEIA